MNVNTLESATDDSDEAESDSEIGPGAQAIKDLELGAQSDAERKKNVKSAVPTGNRRKTKKGLSSSRV